MVKWIRLAGLAFALSMLVSGCRWQPIEKLAIVYGISFEPEQDQHSGEADLVATYLIPLYKKDGFDNLIVEVKGKSTLKLNAEASLRTGGRLVDEKMQVFLIDQTLARKGITPLISQYVNSLSLAANLSLAVTESAPSELLKLPVKKADAATVINNVISKSENTRRIPRTNMLIFARQLVGKGQDPFLPLIHVDEDGKNVVLDGLALFKGDRYVMPLKGYLNMFLFCMMKQPANSGNYESDSGDVRMMIERSKVSYRWQPSRKQLQMRIRINARMIPAVDSLSLDMNDERIKQLESTAEKDFEKQMKKLIRSFQRAGIDPVGFGAIARSQDRNWNEQAWNKMYPELAIQADVQISADEERK